MNKAEIISRHAQALKGQVGTSLAIDECEDIMASMMNEAINFIRCSTQLPDVDKRKEIEEEAYTLNLQNLSGREDFEKAFRIGIMTGIDETIEYIESKAIV